jgi:hypothetical protein
MKVAFMPNDKGFINRIRPIDYGPLVTQRRASQKQALPSIKLALSLIFPKLTMYLCGLILGTQLERMVESLSTEHNFGSTDISSASTSMGLDHSLSFQYHKVVSILHGICSIADDIQVF